MDDYRKLPIRQRQEAFLAMLLHCIGEPVGPRFIGMKRMPGAIVRTGMLIRELLWKEYGIYGTQELCNFRETVKALASRFFAVTVSVEAPDSDALFLAEAARGAYAPDFTWELNCLMAEAYLKAAFTQRARCELGKVEACRQRAQFLGCYTGSSGYPRPSGSWGEVVVVCGVPGQKKDSFAAGFYPGLPVITFDDTLDEPDRYLEQAASLLVRKQPFVWNTSSLTYLCRERILRLCKDFDASVRIVFLESEWDDRLFSMNTPHPEESAFFEWRFCKKQAGN